MKLILAGVFVALTLSFSVVQATAQDEKPNPEASQDTRNEAALAKLKAQPDTVAVYAQGLCCASCAIGIRKKVVGLDFVDQERLTDGVDLDAKTQLVTIALKKGEKLDPKALSKAISDAGYDPVDLYTLKNNKLVTRKLAVN